MQKSRDDRYKSAMDVARDVRRYLAGEPVSAYEENSYEKFVRWAKKNQKVLSRMTMVAVISGVLIFAWRLRSENQQLAAVEEAREQVVQFERLADEAQYFAATSDRLDDSMPYYDVATAERAADQALKISSGWGGKLERLPVVELRDAVKETLHSLLLTTAQSQLNGRTTPDAVEKARALILQAEALYGGSESSLRLQDALKTSRQTENTGVVESTPTNEPGQMAVEKTALDHFLNAEELRRKASRSGTTDGDEWNAHAELLEQAIAGYRAAIRLRTNDFWSHFQMGRCYVSLGKHSEGVETFGACVALRPESPWPYSARGLALAMLDRFDGALSDLDRAIALDDEFLPAKLNRGVAHLLAGNQDLAEREFTILLEDSGETPMAEAAYYRAVLRWEAGDHTAALSDLETILTARPEFPAAMLLQSRIYFLTGNLEQGTDRLNLWLAASRFADGSSEDDLASDSDGWQACFERARFLRRLLSSSIPVGIELDRKGLLTAALAELQESIKLGGESAELYSETGSVLELFGAAQESFAAYTKSLELEPDDDCVWGRVTVRSPILKRR